MPTHSTSFPHTTPTFRASIHIRPEVVKLGRKYKWSRIPWQFSGQRFITIGSMIDPKFNFYCTKERSISTSKGGFKTVTDRFLHCLKKGDYRVTKPIAVFIFLSLLTTATFAAVKSGPYLYLPLDEGSGTPKDLSDNQFKTEMSKAAPNGSTAVTRRSKRRLSSMVRVTLSKLIWKARVRISTLTTIRPKAYLSVPGLR